MNSVAGFVVCCFGDEFALQRCIPLLRTRCDCRMVRKISSFGLLRMNPSLRWISCPWSPRIWRYLHPKSGDIKHVLFGQTVKPNGSLRVYKNWIRFGCYLFASRLGFPCYAGADHKAEGGRKEGTSKSWGGLEVAWTRLASYSIYSIACYFFKNIGLIFGGLRDIDMAFRTSPTIPPHGFVWKQDTPNSNRSSGFSHMLSYFRRACRALLMCLQARKTAERLASDFDNKLRQFRDGRKAPPFWNPVAIFSLELASCLCQYGILQAVPMLNEKVSPFALIYIYI